LIPTFKEDFTFTNMGNANAIALDGNILENNAPVRAPTQGILRQFPPPPPPTPPPPKRATTPSAIAVRTVITHETKRDMTWFRANQHTQAGRKNFARTPVKQSPASLKLVGKADNPFDF
jgi:hypothetical protein